VTPAQRRILAVLEEATGPLTASEIRDALGARSRASITTALRNLASAGWVIATDPGGRDWYRERYYERSDRTSENGNAIP
jgi:DNA-binding transcriptional regulator GbsR (MarR family)